MNQRYKQWKKWLAEPKNLIRFAIFIFVLTTLLFNFLYNTILLLMASLQGANVFSFTQNMSYFWYQFKQTNVMLIIPQILKGSYWLFYLIALAVIGLPLAWTIYKARRAYRDLNKGTKGTARWTTLEEIKAQYPKVSIDKDVEFEGPPGLPIAVDPNRKEMYYDPSNTNSKTSGGTQTGKTQYETYPTIDLNIRSLKPDSMLVNDIKGDITRRTWEHPTARRKFKMLAFNLVNPHNSLRYNPLNDVVKYWETDNDRAQNVIKTISTVLYDEPNAKDPIWNMGAKSVFETVVVLITEIALEEERPEWVNLASVADFIDLTTQEKDVKKGEGYLLDRYVAALPRGHVAQRFYRQAKRATDQQRKSFFMIFDGKLSFLTTSAMMHLTSGNDIDFNDLVFPEDGKPTLLFVIFPFANDFYSTMLSLFYNQLYQTISETVTKKGGKFDIRLQTIFEEFSNIPPIHNIKKHLNVGLEAGNIMRMYFQSNQQVYDNYGDTLGKVILQSAGNSVFIMSDDPEDADAFARGLGDSTVITEQRSGDPLALNKSYTEIEDGRSLINAYELRKLLESEVVLDRTKKRKDLEGNDIRPHPIKAYKKEIKEGEGAKEKTRYEDYTNMLGAWEYLFPEAGGYFDDHGKGLDEFDFKMKQPGGQEGDNLISEKAFKTHVEIPLKPKSEIDDDKRASETDSKKSREESHEEPSNETSAADEELMENAEGIEQQNESHTSQPIEALFDRDKLGEVIGAYFGQDIQVYFLENIQNIGQFNHLISGHQNQISPEEQQQFTAHIQKLRK